MYQIVVVDHNVLDCARHIRSLFLHMNKFCLVMPPLTIVDGVH